ncbi:MAG: type II toxin-antitoxin system RelE/ParE family toxin [Desulfuromonadales bacterium]|nr:type II toxin-antitoxin system RelE/ParE family toxin [Desulfuromonadales bacterium]
MNYDLSFKEEALREWRKLDPTVRSQFKKKLIERLDCPRIASLQLFGHTDRYKIKLRSAGFRLVYEVHDTELLVVIIAVGKRDRNLVYKAADKR